MIKQLRLSILPTGGRLYIQRFILNKTIQIIYILSLGS